MIRMVNAAIATDRPFLPRVAAMLTLCALALLAPQARGTDSLAVAEAPQAWGTDSSTVAEARRLLQSGVEAPQAVRLLEAAAAEGDVGAMYLLGSLYFDGTRVAPDRPLGMAWLQLAIAIDGLADGKTQELISAAQASMSGQELIGADRQFTRLNADLQAKAAQQLAPALRAFTDATPVAYVPGIRFSSEPVQLRRPPEELDKDRFIVGCAAETRSGCPSASRAVAGKDCNGQLFAVDTNATSASRALAKMVMPRYPVPGQRSGKKQGFVRLLAHVGSSGWVCGVAVVVPSGDPAFDAAALKAAARSKFAPATRKGVAAEAFHSFGYSFALGD